MLTAEESKCNPGAASTLRSPHRVCQKESGSSPFCSRLLSTPSFLSPAQRATTIKSREMCCSYFHPGSTLRVRTCEVRGLEADGCHKGGGWGSCRLWLLGCPGVTFHPNSHPKCRGPLSAFPSWGLHEQLQRCCLQSRENRFL